MVEVSTDYRLDELEPADGWMNTVLSEMVALGHTDPQGFVVTPVYFREWTGSNLQAPPLLWDRKQHKLNVNMNSPLIRRMLEVGRRDPYWAGHLFEKISHRDDYSVEKRQTMLIKDIDERFANMKT